MGRFMSPDPSVLDYADPTNPQTLNLYSYVLNNPLIFTDPDGLDCVYTSNQTSSSVTVTTVRGDCKSDTDDGVYVDGHIDTDSYKYTQSNGNYSLNYNYTPDSDSDGDGSGNSQSGTATLGVGKIGLDTPPDPDQLRIQQLAQGITADSQHSFGCIAQAYGAGAPGETMRYMGQPVANTKPFITPGTSLGTSPLSEYARGLPRVSGKFRAPVGGPGTGRAFKMARTGNLGVAAARYAPFVGLALDAISVGQLYNCLGH
jgi:hypothetical protein